MQRSESRTNLLELCRATQHFDDEISKCKGVSAESSLLELCRATQHFDDENQNAKMQKCKTYRKLLIKYKIHFSSFAKPLHFLFKKVFLGLLAVVFFSLGFRILEFRHKNKRTYLCVFGY